MNSDEESALFRKHGWVYDYIGRKWDSPTGTFISIDDVMEMTETPGGEQVIMDMIVQQGVEEATDG